MMCSGLSDSVGASSTILTFTKPVSLSPSLSVIVTPKRRLITSFGFEPSAWSSCSFSVKLYAPLLPIVKVKTVTPFAVPT